MSDHETFGAIRDCVADSLALDPEEVTLSSRLIPDLGADSLDFIDMIFTLEKQFEVKLREGELSFLSRLDVSSPDAMQGGFLQMESIIRLRPWLPALGERDPAQVTPGELFSLITVESLCILVEQRLAERATG